MSNGKPTVVVTEAAATDAGDEDTVRRPPGCLCDLEEGDSCCPVHCNSSCENGDYCERIK
jgi:hypothetical protein